MTGRPWAPGERRRAALLAGAVLGAVLYPLRQYSRPAGRRVDGFPLSYYPMFTARRRQRARVSYAIALEADGTRRYLPEDVLGPGGLNQVRRQLERLVREDRVGPFVDALATRIATEPGFGAVVRVEVIQGEFDLDDCLLSRRVRGAETVVAGADVPGAGGSVPSGTVAPGGSDRGGPPA